MPFTTKDACPQVHIHNKSLPDWQSISIILNRNCFKCITSHQANSYFACIPTHYMLFVLCDMCLFCYGFEDVTFRTLLTEWLLSCYMNIILMSHFR